MTPTTLTTLARTTVSLTQTERKQKRQRLYELLAAMHTGPLGFQLVLKVKCLAKELYNLECFPEVLLEPPATLHMWNYGYCPGCAALSCGPNSPSQCLPGKFLHLAESARKGAEKRRENEVTFIESDLVPCLETNVRHMQIETYRSLASLSKAIVQADAASLRQVV